MKTKEYTVNIEIDIDCEELLDAIGLDYELSKDDNTQNVIGLTLTTKEFKEVFDNWSVLELNEVLIGRLLLNDELSEYCTKVIILTPENNTIIFK